VKHISMKAVKQHHMTCSCIRTNGKYAATGSTLGGCLMTSTADSIIMAGNDDKTVHI
jgi:hypothetical protein